MRRQILSPAQVSVFLNIIRIDYCSRIHNLFVFCSSCLSLVSLFPSAVSICFLVFTFLYFTFCVSAVVQLSVSISFYHNGRMEFLTWISLLFWLTLGVVAEKTSTSSELPAPTPSTIIDILSSQAQYSYFLRHLQRLGLVPRINAMENVTILAPINLAFTGYNVNKNKKNDNGIDNLEESDWLRYIVGQIFRVGYLGREEVVFDTLYHTLANEFYPVSVTPNFDDFEYVVDGVSPIIEPDIYAKHQRSFVQGIERLIPRKPTLCQLLMDEKTVEFNNHKIGHFKKLACQTVVCPK